MHKKLVLLLSMIFILQLVSAEDIYSDCSVYGNCKEAQGTGIASNVNYSMVNVNNSNYLEGYNVSSLWGYYSGLGNTLWCKLTGCTMDGDIDMHNNSIYNVANIYNKTEVDNITSGLGEDNNNVAILNNVNTYNTVSNTDNRAYPSTALINNVITYQVNNVTGDILPTADSSYSIGSSVLRWLKGWFVEMDVGNSSGNVVLNSDGIKLYGDATSWDDLTFPVANLRINPATSKPDEDTTNVLYLFDDTNVETVRGSGQSSHSQKNNTGLYCHVHWLQTASGSVNWSLNYSLGNLGTTTQTWNYLDTNSSMFAYSAGELEQLTYFPVTQVNVTDVSAIFRFKVSREGGSSSDTMVGDAKFQSFDCHYEKDSLGSNSEYSK
jgi:hypothetical protein